MAEASEKDVFDVRVEKLARVQTRAELDDTDGGGSGRSDTIAN